MILAPEKDVQMFETQIFSFQSFYGMSETSPIMFTNTSEDTFEQRTSTVGRVAEHSEVWIFLRYVVQKIYYLRVCQKKKVATFVLFPTGKNCRF